MKKHIISAALVFAASLTALPAADYTIDPSHTSAAFSVRHMMVSNVKGQFNKVTGTVSFDPANPAATKIDATIDVSTLNTNEPNRDKHLKSPDFFDVEKFPTMHFVSKKTVKSGDGLKITGDLTIHGVTKQVVLDVDGPSPEVKDPMGNFRRGASASTTVDRTQFGLTWNKAMEAGGVLIGNDVKITIDIEAFRK